MILWVLGATFRFCMRVFLRVCLPALPVLALLIYWIWSLVFSSLFHNGSWRPKTIPCESGFSSADHPCPSTTNHGFCCFLSTVGIRPRLIKTTRHSIYLLPVPKTLIMFSHIHPHPYMPTMDMYGHPRPSPETCHILLILLYLDHFSCVRVWCVCLRVLVYFAFVLALILTLTASTYMYMSLLPINNVCYLMHFPK